MSDYRLEPYIFFPGNCREAMEFYKGIFGGELTLQTYADVGMGEGDMKDKIMHAKLDSGAISLMGSDTEKASQEAKKISLSLSGKEAEDLRKIFASLSEAGTVQSELKTEFWGDTFGSLVDRYGVEWMVNIEKADS